MTDYMTKLMNYALTTITKIILRGRFIPYIACALFFEIYYVSIMLSLLYGRAAGAAAGSVAAVFLCWAIISVFYESDRGKAALCILFDVHVALAAAMLLRFAAGNSFAVPLWVVIERIAFFVPDIAAVWVLSQKRGGSSGGF